MKNKRFLKIFSLFLMFGLVFGIGISSYAYSYDETTGNISSDNFLDSPSSFNVCNSSTTSNPSIYGAYVLPNTEYKLTYKKSRIEGVEVSDVWVYIFKKLSFRSTSSSETDISSVVGSVVRLNNTYDVTYSFTTPDLCNYVLIDFSNNNVDSNVNTWVQNPMVLYPSVTLSEYEPYNVWYSSENYNTYGQEMYNDGVASVTTMFNSCDSIQMTLGSNSAVTYDGWEEWYTAYLWESGSTTGFYRVQDGGLNFYWNRYVNYGYGSMGDTVKLVFTWNYGNYPSTSQYNYYFISAYTGSSIVINSPDSYAIYTTTSSLSLPTDSNTAISSIIITFNQVGVGSYDSTIKTTNDTLNAYNNGYDNGYETGYNKGYDEGYESGEDIGSAEGYNEGITDNVTTNGFKTLFNSILSYPINMIKTVFNFEFMGINIAGLITFIISIGIVAFLIAHFRKK